VGLLAHALGREAGVRLLVLERGGLAALDLLRRGLVHLAGLHFSTTDHPDRNQEIARRELGPGHHLIRVASWEEGLARPVSERRTRTSTFSTQNTTWALREPGSAARDCLDEFLGRKKTPTGRVVAGHAAVAGSIRSGWADAGVCVRLSAEEAGLAFQPLRTEALDFCLADGSLADPRVKALLRVLRSREHRRLLDELPGYDASETGEVFAS
jgi:molybdate-binding protein